MLNLLFISDSPKVEYLKSVLQPVLKVIIDIVTDFDLGLKDVFEKRPTTVCIQDEIGGVTSESVARHIQMLLGKNAPTFILLHKGNGNARAINGLYEYLIDLSQPNDVLEEDIKNTLKLLLGDQWAKIAITPASLPHAAEHESSVVAPADASPPPDDDFGTCHSDILLSASDEVAELILEGKNRVVQTSDNSAVISPVIEADSGTLSDEDARVVTAVVVPHSMGVADSPGLAEISNSGPQKTKSVIVSPSVKPVVNAPPTPVKSTLTPPAAAFRINQKAPPVEDPFPEDPFQKIAENTSSKSHLFSRRVVVVLTVILIAAGGWYIASQEPQLISSMWLRFMPSPEAKKTLVPSAVLEKKPVQSVVPLSTVTPTLPAFIPKEGYDSTFATKKPGWERYVGKLAEFRLYRVSGRIKAVQLLAVNNTTIPESLLKSVLLEYVGSSKYQITSRTIKAGVHVESGIIPNKGDILIYRNRESVKGLVISIN